MVTWLARGVCPVDGTGAFRRPVSRRPRARGGERAGHGARPAAVAASAVAACLTLGATALVAPAPAVAAEDATGETHRPGEPGHSVDVLEDTTYETANGTTEPHPCAGRRLLYQSHIDALYATRDQGGKLTMAVVNGQQVEPAEESCLRLAPDADDSGKEVSRFRLPDNPALSFLGRPGDVLWIGPQHMPFLQNFRPLWAGIGAFDPAHEYEVPTDFENGEVTFELTDFSGPEGGQVHNFFGRFGDSEMERMFGAPEGAKSFTAPVGSHGHYNWTFSEPGIYSFTWKVRGRHADGAEEVSEEVTQTWLVGSDAQVGLPEGTTTDLNEITEPVEPGSNDPSDNGKPGEAGTPGKTEEPSAPAEPERPGKPGSGATSTPGTSAPGKPGTPGDNDAPAEARHPISSGHMDLALGEKGGKPSVYLKDQEDVTNEQGRDSGTFTFLVPDTARKDVRGRIPGIDGKAWVLPDVQDPKLPWVGFSTTDAGDAVSKSAPVTVRIADLKGPGRMVTTHSGLFGSTVELDSEDPDSSVTYGPGAHDHQAFVFTEPGDYTVTFSFTGTFAGEDLDERLEVHFAVGDKAVAAAKGDVPDDADGLDHAFSGLNKAVEKLGDALVKAVGSFFGTGSGDARRDGTTETRPTSKADEPTSTDRKGKVLGETAVPTSANGSRKAASGKTTAGGKPASGGGSASAGGASAGAKTGSTPDKAPAQAKSAGKSSGSKAGNAPVQAKSSKSSKPSSSPKASKESKANGSGGGMRRLGKDGADGKVAAEKNHKNKDGDANSVWAERAGTRPGVAERETAATGSVGTPDWWSGLVLGLGIAALVAGLIMLFNARRTARETREDSSDIARGASQSPWGAG
ncbi:choice-of-anchor M domain-containing protein [Corynebacterium frankenforstense]